MGLSVRRAGTHGKFPGGGNRERRSGVDWHDDIVHWIFFVAEHSERNYSWSELGPDVEEYSASL